MIIEGDRRQGQVFTSRRDRELTQAEAEKAQSPRLFTRRSILLGAVVGLGAAEARGINLGTAQEAASLSRAYGPLVIENAIHHPGETGKSAWYAIRHPEVVDEVKKLIVPPPREYENSYAFRHAKLEYKKDERNIIVLTGDSNAKKSIVDEYINLARKKGFYGWTAYDFSEGGSTIQDVITRQIPKAIEVFKLCKKLGIKYDVIVNVGGDDAKTLIQGLEDVKALEALAKDPAGNLGVLSFFLARMNRAMDLVGQDSLSLLNTINVPEFRQYLRQIVFMSLPDLSQATSIETQEVEGSSHIIALDSTARPIVGNECIRMSNKESESITTFTHLTGVKVVGIDTAKHTISRNFIDQHFNDASCKKIAQVMESKMHIGA